MEGITEEQYKKILIEEGFPILSSYNTKGTSFVNKNPILFRGCHVAELHPDVKFSNIQGRPNDRTYNGNILHLTNNFPNAYTYGTSNKRGNDKWCIVCYNSKLLSEYGEYLPDIIDGNGARTPDESIKNCNQVRWKCHEDIIFKSQIEHTINFIYYEGEIFTCVSSVLNYRTSSYNNILIKKDYCVYYEDFNISFFIRCEGHRITRMNSQYQCRQPKGKIVFDSEKHKYITIREHLFEVTDSGIQIFEASPLYFSDYNLSVPVNMFDRILFIKENNYKRSIKPVYPVRIGNKRRKVFYLLRKSDLLPELQDYIFSLYLLL